MLRRIKHRLYLFFGRRQKPTDLEGNTFEISLNGRQRTFSRNSMNRLTLSFAVCVFGSIINARIVELGCAKQSTCQ